MAELSSPSAATTRRAAASRRRRRGAQILEAAQRLFERAGLRGDDDGGDRAEAGVALKTVYLAFETKSGAAARALGPAPARRRGRRAGRRAPVVPRGPRGARPRAPAAARTRATSRVVKKRAAALHAGDPRRGRAPTPTSPRSGAASRPTSTTTSARSSRACTRRRRCARPRRRPRRPTSSGRSTTPTSGCCSSASAAGRPRSTSSGSPTRPAPSSCAAEGPRPASATPSQIGEADQRAHTTSGDEQARGEGARSQQVPDLVDGRRSPSSRRAARSTHTRRPGAVAAQRDRAGEVAPVGDEQQAV